MAERRTARSASRSLGLLISVVLTSYPGLALSAGSRASVECARAAEEGQTLRDEGKLLRAREAFSRCIRPTCPAVIAKECASWLDDVAARMPSVVVVAKDARGGDLADAKVFVDGTPREGAGRGRALELEPGTHRLRVEGGGLVLEETIVLRERERDRRVELRPPPPAAPPSPPSPTKRVAGRPIPTGVYVLSGTSVALGALGAVFGVTAASTYSSLKDRCPSDCTESDLSGLRRLTVTADVAFSLAVVASVSALVLYLTRATVSRELPSVAQAGFTF